MPHSVRSWRYGVCPQACPTASGAGILCSGPGVPHSIRSWHYGVWARACPTQHPELVIWQQMQQVQQARRRRRRRTRRRRKGVRRRRRGAAPLLKYFKSRDPHPAVGEIHVMQLCMTCMLKVHTRAPLLSRRDKVPIAKMRLSLSTMRWFFSGVLQPRIRKHNHSVNSNTMEPKAVLYNTLLPNIFCSMTITRYSTIRLTYSHRLLICWQFRRRNVVGFVHRLN